MIKEREKKGFRKSRKTVKKNSSPEDPENHLYIEPTPYVTNPALASMPISLNIPNSDPRSEKPGNEKQKTFLDRVKDKIFSNSKQEGKKIINKLDITGPTDFQHKQHIGQNGQVYISI